MASGFTAYRAVLRSRVRAQQGYRVSFATDLFATVLTGLAELLEVYVIFHNLSLIHI